MEILEIVEQLEDSVEKGFSIFGYSFLHKEDILAMVDDIRLKMPDELKQARWIKEEKQRILMEAQKEAEHIINVAKEKVITMIDEHEIVKEAQSKAAQVTKETKAANDDLKLNAVRYADSLLERVETSSAMILEEVRSSRSQLKK